MKTIRQIIQDLNIARSNDCSEEKSKEFKDIIQFLVPYAEAQEAEGGEVDEEYSDALAYLYFKATEGADMNERMRLKDAYDAMNEEIQSAQKQLEKAKAFDIINRKRIQVDDLNQYMCVCDTDKSALESYNFHHSVDEEGNDRRLTMEEFKLLRRML